MIKTWFFKVGYTVIVISLLWCTMSVRACTNSTSQSTIKMTFYADDTAGTDPYAVSDIVLDSSSNQYLLYASTISTQNIRISKINSNGTFGWSVLYTNMVMLNHKKSMLISSDGSALRVIAQDANNPCRFAEISTTDGAINVVMQSTADIRLSQEPYGLGFDCSPVTDSKCFFIAINDSYTDYLRLGI